MATINKMPDAEREIVSVRIDRAMDELSKCAYTVRITNDNELITLLYHAGMTLKSLREKLDAQRDNKL